jgi:hypothetical protein
MQACKALASGNQLLQLLEERRGTRGPDRVVWLKVWAHHQKWVMLWQVAYSPRKRRS